MRSESSNRHLRVLTNSRNAILEIEILNELQMMLNMRV